MLVSPTLVRMEVPVLYKKRAVTDALVLLDMVGITVKLHKVMQTPITVNS